MQVVGAGWLVYHLTGSAMQVGVLAALALGPSLVGAPIGGVLADRFCPRKLSITLCTAQAVPAGVMAILAFAGLLSVPWIFVLVLLGAVPYSLNQPIIALVVPFTVPPELRHEAVTASSMAYNLSRLTGAVLGGVVVQVIGPGGAFALNSASYLVVAVVLLFSPVIQASCDAARAHQSSGLAGGLRTGWHVPVVRVALLGAAVFFLIVAPIEQLMPKIAADHSDGAMMLGLLLAALGIGALSVNPILRHRVHDARTGGLAVAVGLVTATIGLALLAVSPWLVTDFLALFIVGISWELVFVSGQGSLQLEVPRDIRGRMIGLFYLLVTGATALGALALGMLFDYLGVRTSLLLGAAVVAVGAGVLLVRPSRIGPEDSVEAGVG